MNQTEVGNILGRLDSLDVQAGEASESIAQLRGALKAMQDELRDLKASVDDIPNHHPSHSWVREHVAAESTCRCCHHAHSLARVAPQLTWCPLPRPQSPTTCPTPLPPRRLSASVTRRL